MFKTRLFLFVSLLLIVFASGAAFAQTPTITITSPFNGQVVDTSVAVNVSGTYSNLPVEVDNILVQARLADGTAVGEGTTTVDGSGNWAVNGIVFNFGIPVPPGTPGNVIAFARTGGDPYVISPAVNVTWGIVQPTVAPTATPTNTLTATWTPTNTFTPTLTWTPTNTWTPTSTQAPAATLTITTPAQNSIFPIGIPAPVAGISTNLLANGLTVRALNANSDILAQASVVQDGSGNWLANLNVNVPVGTRGSIYAFASRPGDGLIYASYRVDVTYGGPCVVRGDWQTYIVQPGDTLFRIASRVASTINELALANCLTNTNLINAGQQLRVPRLPVPPPTAVLNTLRILSPLANSTVDTSARLTVSGSGRGIAGYNIVVRAINQLGEVIGQQVATAGGANANGESAWQLALFVAVPPGTAGSIYAFASAPNNGNIVADDLINVTFGLQAAPTPAPTQSIPGVPIEGEIEVLINTPVENQTFVLANPIVNGRVIGLSEGNIVVRVLDAESNVLAEETIALTPISNGDSSWQLSLPLDVPLGTRATIFAYVPDPMLGGVVASDAVNVVVGESTTDPFVTINDPLPYAILSIDEPLVITGYGARLFEGNVVVRLLDDEGGVLAETVTTVNSPNAGTGGEGGWQVTLDVNAAAGTRGSVYAFSTSAQDGSIIAAARRYVTFGDPSTGSNFVEITTPLPGTIVTPDNALLIVGRADINSGESVTVQIFDEIGNILIEEPRPLTPVPNTNYGTWEVILELQGLATGTRIRVNAFTTSSFDGSILASDTVGLLYSED